MVALTLLPLAFAASAARAHGGADVVPIESEAQLRATETAALGAEHAEQHALARAAARERAAELDAMSPTELREWQAGQQASAHRLAAAAQASVAGRPKNEIGSWSAPFGLPDYVMNAALLHTGEVAMWGWLPYEAGPGGTVQRPLRGENWFWDTSKPLPGLLEADTAGAFRRDDAPQITIGATTQTPPLYCSGISFLPDGRLLIAGGNLAFTEEDPAAGKGWKGLDTLFIYDPKTKTWTQGPTMQAGRWYPTQVMLADGRTWIGGGFDEVGNEALVERAELLNAAADALTPIAAPALAVSDVWGDIGWPGLYPHAWVMPGGQVLVVPREWGRAAALFNPGTLTYAPDSLDQSQRPEKEGATAVLLPRDAGPANTVMQMGGFAYLKEDGVTADGVAQPVARTLSYSRLTAPAPWAAARSLNVGRSYHNTVLLPGGGMVTVGGGAGQDPSADPTTRSGLYYDGNGKQELLNVELFDAETRRWTLGPPQQHFRAYHSVALLLPDGRVWSAGDDWHEDIVRDATGSPWRGNAEIYSPPYLFGGIDPATGAFNPDSPAQRTEIVGAPGRLRWGDQATVTTTSDDVGELVLVAPSAVTHSIDTNQRHVGLEIVERVTGQGVKVRLPGDATTAPPGWYMLFALNGCGAPSHAKWVRVGEPLPGDPPATTPPPPPGPRSGLATCSPPQSDPPPNQVGPQGIAPASVFPKAVTPPKARKVTIKVLRVTRSGLRKRGTVTLVVRMSEGGLVRVKALLKRRGHRAVVLGTDSRRFRRAGQAELRIRVSRAGRKALRRPGPLTLSLEATGTGANGKRGRAVAKRRL